MRLTSLVQKSEWDNYKWQLDTQLAKLKDSAARPPQQVVMPPHQITQPQVTPQAVAPSVVAQTAGASPAPLLVAQPRVAQQAPARPSLDLDAKIPTGRDALRMHQAQLITEVARKQWTSNSRTAKETRAHFECPWGAQCKTKGLADKACNNVHTVGDDSLIQVQKEINIQVQKDAASCWRHVVEHLSALVEERLNKAA